MNIIESEVWKGSGLIILGEMGNGGGMWEETEHKLYLWMRTMGDGERAEGGMGTWWRGAMEGEKIRNICNNMNNKYLF